ncbi:hypothetical protein [Vibrio marisflavi]|jgi:hypothetical protein|uniref:hypothetical protein n=1 Tax=Vibrio marisflavi TaxID=1216040 RepID=UPI001F48E511|nr:hypothetical protein [Vibrio marisflavi]
MVRFAPSFNASTRPLLVEFNPEFEIWVQWKNLIFDHFSHVAADANAPLSPDTEFVEAQSNCYAPREAKNGREN